MSAAAHLDGAQRRHRAGCRDVTVATRQPAKAGNCPHQSQCGAQDACSLGQRRVMYSSNAISVGEIWPGCRPQLISDTDAAAHATIDDLLDRAIPLQYSPEQRSLTEPCERFCERRPKLASYASASTASGGNLDQRVTQHEDEVSELDLLLRPHLDLEITDAQAPTPAARLQHRRRTPPPARR